MALIIEALFKYIITEYLKNVSLNFSFMTS